ncbi:MAG: 6,7-dimethyl-8-ribityllumazine synthase [Candidatus Eremiobacteraeota bacterium]|nr:6,7-dimethyl-8-ribityllumazine synthase [Candidatus Eremiobacteraeota bacterium]
MRFAIVRALFNGDITAALLTGAENGFAGGGVEPADIDVFEVPGAFELPLCASWLVDTKRYDAIVCLGCVIRGETAHFEYVAREAACGIAEVALRSGVPVIFGVLTTETLEQARQRASVGVNAGGDHGATPAPAPSNKGYESAQSAMRMAALRKRLDF